MKKQQFNRSSPRLKDANRTSVITSRIAGMNMIGTKKFYGFFDPKEIFNTLFTIEVQLGNFTWTVRKTLDECKDFFDCLQSDKRERFDVIYLYYLLYL